MSDYLLSDQGTPMPEILATITTRPAEICQIAYDSMENNMRGDSMRYLQEFVNEGLATKAIIEFLMDDPRVGQIPPSVWEIQALAVEHMVRRHNV